MPRTTRSFIRATSLIGFDQHRVEPTETTAKGPDMKGHHAPHVRRRMRRLFAFGLCALAGHAFAGTTQPARTWLVSGAELITLLQGKGADGFCDGEQCRSSRQRLYPGRCRCQPRAVVWAGPDPST